MTTPVPGDFHARCNLKRHVPEKKLSQDEIQAAKAAGHPRVFVDLRSERVDRETGRHGRWEYLLPACDGFETTDKAAFGHHMREVHNRPLIWARGYNEVLAATTRAGWRRPSMAPEGKDLPKAAAQRLRRCPTCRLYGEVVGNAGELWWDEHVRGCALVAAS